MSWSSINSDTLRLLGIETDTRAKTRSISQPNYSSIDGVMTKTAPAMSEDKYKEEIIALAKKDAANGKFGGHKNPSYMVLKKSFVSVVSPDRKSMIAEALRQLPFMQRGKVNYLEIKDSSGDIIASFSPNNGWHSIGSKSEIQRESEFDAIYTGAWREATNAMKNPDNQSSNGTVRNSVDFSV